MSSRLAFTGWCDTVNGVTSGTCGHREEARMGGLCHDTGKSQRRAEITQKSEKAIGAFLVAPFHVERREVPLFLSCSREKLHFYITRVVKFVISENQILPPLTD